MIDDTGNKYGISKHHAILKLLDAVKNDPRGKIIRVGSLMGQHSDGEFRITFNTNAFPPPALGGMSGTRDPRSADHELLRRRRNLKHK